MEQNTTQINALLHKLMLVIGRFFFRFRNALFPVIFLALVALVTPSIQFGCPSVDTFLTELGIALALLGACVRLGVIGFAYIQRGGKDGKVYADDLVVEGLYAHSRNPMYVGNILIAVGIGVMYGSLWMYLLVIPFFIFVYLCIVAAEEEFLRNKFGVQFDEYCKSVPRFLPNLGGLAKTLKGHPCDWKKVLRKDYGTLSATLAGIVLLLIWKLYRIEGFEASKFEILKLGLLLVPIAVFYVMIRKLKRSGKLGNG